MPDREATREEMARAIKDDVGSWWVMWHGFTVAGRFDGDGAQRAAEHQRDAFNRALAARRSMDRVERPWDDLRAAPIGTRLAGVLAPLREADRAVSTLHDLVWNEGGRPDFPRDRANEIIWLIHDKLRTIIASPVTPVDVEAALRAVPTRCADCGSTEWNTLCHLPSGDTTVYHNMQPDLPAMARAVLALWAQEAKG